MVVPDVVALQELVIREVAAGRADPAAVFTDLTELHRPRAVVDVLLGAAAFITYSP